MSDDWEPDEREFYQIRVQGRLDESWSDWFEGMTIVPESAITTLTGPVADQAALHGILDKIWNLNLALISVTRMGTGPG
jgi:hypothetical protein